jgi:hypothetical protein
MSKTFTIETTVSYLDLWEAIWGSDGTGITYWCDRLRKPNNQGIDLWTKTEDGNLVGNPQNFKLHDYQEEKWHTVTLEDLAKGYRLALEHKSTHCGHYSVTDLDEADACTGDIILQYAIFGEVVYG